jgi:hypothetical protein
MDALRWADWALEDATQAGQGAFFYDDFVARLEGMARQTAFVLDPAKLSLDHFDCLVRDDRGVAIETQNATEPRDPLQGGDAGRREIAAHKKVGREERNRALGRARIEERQKRREAAAGQGLRDL